MGVDEMRLWMLIFGILLLCPALVLGQSATEYSTIYTASKGNVHVKTEITLSSPTNGFVDIPIADDYVNLVVSLDGKDTENTIIIRNGTTVTDFKITNLNRNIIVEYDSQQFITTSNINIFISSTPIALNSEKVRIRFILPEYATLVHKSNQLTLPYIPKAYISTDGNQIMLSWNYDNIQAGDTLQQLALYETPSTAIKDAFWGLGLIAIVLVVIILVIVALSRGAHLLTKPAETKLGAPRGVTPEQKIVTPGLKEKEEQVVNVIKLKGGQTTQGTLQIATDMPKGTLSGIIKELVDRKILHKEKKGNKNVITLKDEFMNKPEQNTDAKQPE
jgi:uncharacterized membrane protein